MRILVAHLVGLERSGGMSRLMGRAHDELERAGHEVDYLSADDVGATTRGTAGRFLFPWAVRKKVVEAVRQRRPYDVVNVHEPHGAAVAMLRGGQDGTAVVAMTHGVEQRGWEMSLAHSETRPSWKTRCVYPASSLWQSRLALRCADHVICLNTQDRQFLAERFGVDSARITRVTPGADTVFGETAAARRYGPPKRLLFAGTWIPRKGIHILAAAFDRLCSAGSTLQLDVLGAGVPEECVLGDFSAAVRDRVPSRHHEDRSRNGRGHGGGRYLCTAQSFRRYSLDAHRSDVECPAHRDHGNSRDAGCRARRAQRVADRARRRRVARAESREADKRSRIVPGIGHGGPQDSRYAFHVEPNG